MYLVTDITNKSIIRIGETISYWSNGYPEVAGMAFVNDCVNIHEIESVPSEVIPEKYCYTEEDGFYINPNYIEPDATNTYGIPDDIYHAIIDDYTAELFGGEE